MELFDQLMHNWLLSSWVFYTLQGKLAWSWSILLSEILKVNSWAVIHFVSFLCNWSFRSRNDQSLRPQALVRELSALPCKESLDKLKLDSSRKLLWVVEIGIFTVLWLSVLYLAAYRCSSWLNRTWDIIALPARKSGSTKHNTVKELATHHGKKITETPCAIWKRPIGLHVGFNEYVWLPPWSINAEADFR